MTAAEADPKPHTSDPLPLPERSSWGWGYAHRFPDDDQRRMIAAHVAHLIGVDPPALRPLPRLDGARVPAPKIAVPEALAAFSSDSAADRMAHTYGKSFRDQLRAFRGDFAAAPDFVSFARHEDDIATVLRWASERGVAVLPYGGGTSVVSGFEADLPRGYTGAISLDLRLLDRVLDVDPVSRSARIQAGASGPRIEAQLHGHGLSLRHFPQSFEFSTLGGWIATRAGGHFATVYTHIDDLVQNVRVLTPAGPFVTRRLPASGAGPQPERLILGSEGTLGVITEAWMRVFPRPTSRVQAAVHFTDFRGATTAARRIAQAALYPTNCRLLSAEEAALFFVADDGSHVLLVAFESADAPRDDQIARALAICEAEGGRAPRGIVRREGGERAAEGPAQAWRAAFLEAPYLQSALLSLGLVVDTFETACTWDAFEALHENVVRAVQDAMARTCGGGRVTLRFTHVYPDGPAPYYTFVAPAPRAGMDAIDAWWEIKRAASDALAAGGATITHHHAVGRLHRPWYEGERPHLFAEALSAAKRALDPSGVMNPGALFGPETEALARNPTDR